MDRSAYDNTRAIEHAHWWFRARRTISDQLARLNLRPGANILEVAHPWPWSRHDELHHHKRRYRREEYIALLEGAGFSLTPIGFFNTVLYPMVVAARAAKLSERSGKADDAMPSKPMNATREHAFAAEKFLLRHIDLPFGVSLLAVARPHAGRGDLS